MPVLDHCALITFYPSSHLLFVSLFYSMVLNFVLYKTISKCFLIISSNVDLNLQSASWYCLPILTWICICHFFLFLISFEFISLSLSNPLQSVKLEVLGSFLSWYKNKKGCSIFSHIISSHFLGFYLERFKGGGICHP